MEPYIQCLVFHEYYLVDTFGTRKELLAVGGIAEADR